MALLSNSGDKCGEIGVWKLSSDSKLSISSLLHDISGDCRVLYPLANTCGEKLGGGMMFGSS